MNNNKLSTIQKRDNLNVVYRFGEIGPGGAYHEYDVYGADQSIEDSEPLARLRFQKGARQDPDVRCGVFDEDLLEIVRDRLTCFQHGEFATMENYCALYHIEEALMWLNKRKEDRAERNVLGTYEK